MAGSGPNQVTGVAATFFDTSPNSITVSWTNISSDQNYRVYWWKNVDDGAWEYWGYTSDLASSLSGYAFAVGYKYGFRGSSVWKCVACENTWYWADGTAAGTGTNPTFTLSSYTTPVYRSVYSDTKTGGIKVGGTYSDILYSVPGVPGAYSYATTGAIGVSGSYTDQLDFSDTYTGGIKVGGLYSDAVVTPVNYVYYIGTDDGVVYRFGPDYAGDRGLPITASWESKTIDFSDVDPSFTTLKKTIYGVTLFYEDLATSADFAVYISSDGGTTWSSVSKLCGTTTGKVAEQTYTFLDSRKITGQYFKFKIEHGSANKDLKWLGLRVEYEPQGKYFALS